MRPTSQHEIVFESTLEARVAAQLIHDAGRADLLAAVTPPIKPASIGRIAFFAGQVNEQRGRGDNAEYTCPASIGSDVIAALVQTAELPCYGEPAVTRQGYMGEKIVGYMQQLDSL